MFETEGSGVLHYFCHVGHSWSPQTLLDAQRQTVEAALYNAASKLREIAALHRRLADAPSPDKPLDPEDRDRHLRAADRADRNSEKIVSEILRGGDEQPIGTADEAPEATG